MSKRAICAVLALACLAALPGSSAAEEPPTQTAVIGVDFPPICFNSLLDTCNINWAHAMMGMQMAGAHRVRPDFGYDPVLVERVDVEPDPFALTYHIRPDAVWSDGTPVTADDFLFTLDVIRDPANTTSVARQAYADLVSAEKLAERSLRLAFSRVQIGWQTLFSIVLPKHVLLGHDFDEVWREGLDDPATGEPVGSGPFLFASSTPFDSATFTRNPRWWGDTKPSLDTMVFRFVLTVNRIQAIRDGAVDVIFPQSDAAIAELYGVDEVEVEWREGTVMEHLDFNVGSTTMPLLQHAWFRKAVAHALDRPGAAAAAFGMLIPAYPVLQSLAFRAGQDEYEPTFAGYDYDPAQVASLLSANGCALGADGVWVCDGIRASVKLATVTGNATRAAMQEHLIAHARAAGVELVTDNDAASVLFGVRLPARDYEAIMFAWITPPGASQRNLYACGGATNSMGYCSPAFDALLLQGENTVDDRARAALFNDGYDVVAADMPTIPLLARPVFLVRRDRLNGPQVNPGGNATWNVEEWRIGDDVTPPTVTCTASPSRIWLYNGKLVPVAIDVTVTDDGSGSAGFVLTGASSDEPGEGDIQDFAVGTPDVEGRIRAEREPEGDGRTYTFTYEGTDVAGNTATCAATVEIVRRKRGS